MLLWFILLVVLFLYIFFEVNYFLKSLIVIVIAKYFRRKISIEEPSVIYGMVVPSDVDLVLSHLNNARYFREYDFGRIDFATRTGLLEYLLKKGQGLVSAFHMRYRLPTMLFSPYKVVTRVVYWDSKYLYLDQRLITLKDDIVRAAGYAKLSCAKIDLDLLFKKMSPNLTKPEIPEDLKKWNEVCELSSQMMQKERLTG